MAFVCVAAGLVAGAVPALALKVEEIESQKGIKAWLVEEHSVPLIAIRFAFIGGALQDPTGKEGLAGALADLLTEGAGDLPAAAFKDRISILGANLSMSSGRDTIFGGMETVSKRFEPSADLLRLALTAPRFDAGAIEQVKAQRLSDLALAAQQPITVARDRWYAEAFPGHAYGRPPNGTPQSVGGLTSDDLKAQHARLLAKDVLRVVIVGDIDKAGAIRAIDTIFGGLADKAQVKPIDRVEARVLPGPVVITEDHPLATSVFGLASLRNDHPDFPALQVLNQVIGSGDFDSRLMAEIRVKRGLAYSVRTNLLNDTTVSLLVGGISTKNEAMREALVLVKDVLSRTAKDGPSQAEFDNAKLYLNGSYLLDFDTNAKVAGSLLGIWLDNRKPDYLLGRKQQIDRVTLADVKRVAAQVLQPDRMIVTVVGKPNPQP